MNKKEEEKEGSEASFVRMSCYFKKEEIQEKIDKTIGKKLVKLLLADMRTDLLKKGRLNQQIFTMYDKRLHLKNITILEHKPDHRFNRFKFEFINLVDNQDYFITLDFLDVLYFQNDVEEILLKKF